MVVSPLTSVLGSWERVTPLADHLLGYTCKDWLPVADDVKTPLITMCIYPRVIKRIPEPQNPSIQLADVQSSVGNRSYYRIGNRWAMRDHIG